MNTIDYKKTVDRLKGIALIKPGDKCAVCMFKPENNINTITTSDFAYIIAANANELKLFAIDKKTGEFLDKYRAFKKSDIRYAKRIKNRNFIWAGKGLLGGRYISIHFIADDFVYDYVIPQKINGYEQIEARKALFEFVKNTYNPYYTELQKLYKEKKAYKVTLSYADIEKDMLAKDPGINTISIADIDFVIKEDKLFSAFGHFKANAYGTVDSIEVKVDLAERMFLENHVDIKPEFTDRLAKLFENFEARYNTVVDRIAAATADYLNAHNLRAEPYTIEETKENIDAKSITILLPNDCAFMAYLEDEYVAYVEYDDGTYKVDVSYDDDGNPVVD